MCGSVVGAVGTSEFDWTVVGYTALVVEIASIGDSQDHHPLLDSENRMTIRLGIAGFDCSWEANCRLLTASKEASPKIGNSRN